MKQHRIQLGSFPTPLVTAPDLGKVVGIDQLWVKRDDLTGYSWGGNKIRTIEFLLADAVNQAADSVIICGGPTSNFAALMSIACAHHGLAVHRISYGSMPEHLPAALNVSLQAGAFVEYTHSADRSVMETAADAAAIRLRTEGKSPYVVPRGGATAVGALGFAYAAVELNDQLESMGLSSIKPASIRHESTKPGLTGANKITIVLPVGSGGTIAGLIAGWTYALDNTVVNSSIDIDIVGVSVSRAPENLNDHIASIVSNCAAHFGVDNKKPVSSRCKWRLVDGRGTGFGIASDQESLLIDEIASRSRFMADATYNSKALVWLQASGDQLTGTVLYWHTGGALGVIDRMHAKNECQPNKSPVKLEQKP